VSDFEALIKRVDALEETAAGYLSLEEVRAAAGEVNCAIRAYVLLVDYRTRQDGTPLTLCRLNRRHPDVMRLTSW
jgi:hypothetical protein